MMDGRLLEEGEYAIKHKILDPSLAADGGVGGSGGVPARARASPSHLRAEAA